MRLIDADELFEKFRTTFPASEVLLTVNQAPTVCDIEQIRAEIELQKKGFPPSADYYKAINRALDIIDKYTGSDNADRHN